MDQLRSLIIEDHKSLMKVGLGGERACFLTHVRLVRRDAGGVGVGDNGGDVSPDDTLEDETSSNSSYV